MKYFSHFETIGYEIEPALSHLRATYPGRKWVDSSGPWSLKFKANILICADVIEHLADPIILLETIAASEVGTIFLSTPALEILAEQGRSPRLGPPNNQTHYNEWTTAEFREFVGRYLKIIDHTVCRADQGTQLIIARRV